MPLINFWQRIARYRRASKSTEEKPHPTIAVPAIMLATATVALLWQSRIQMDETDWVEHTDRVMLVAEQAKTEFLQAQKSLAGLLVSLDPAQRSLPPEHWNKSQQLIGQLVDLVADNPAQEQNLTALNGLENQWLEAARDVDPTHADAQKREVAARAAAVGDKVLLQFDTISAAEQELWTGRDARRDLHYRIVLLVIPIAALILVIALTTVAWREIRRASAAFADALRQAEAANQSKTNFLAVVSHELRNPLNSILLWCNALMSGGTLEGKTEQGINAIFRGAKAQAQLIEDLLDIARIESGQMRFDVQPIDSAEVVRAAVESMTPAAEAKSIAVQVVIDPRASMVMGDSHRLQQAVWNLLSNAIKFTPKGGKVQVRLERINSTSRSLSPTMARESTGARSTASSSDSGKVPITRPGPRDGSRSFDRKAHRQSSRRHGYRTQRRLGTWECFFDSAAAAGDDRRFGESRAPASDGDRSRSQRANAAPGRDIRALRRRRSGDARRAQLIADLARRQSQDGAQRRERARAARSIESRRDYFRPWNARPRRLFAHQGDPGAGKETVTAEHLPAIALTAYGRVEDRVEVFSAGFDSHVVKPVDPAELAAVIKRLVEARRSASDKASPTQGS